MRSSCFNLFLAGMVLAACGAARAQAPSYQLGRTPSPEEIRNLDISVSPQGEGLPPGSGTAQQGAPIYAQKCAACHGPNGEGMGEAARGSQGPRLVGGRGTLNTANPVKTVGSFWAFATSVWDYIHRAMPRGAEGTLRADEVYAVTAFLLWRNQIIQESDVLDAQTLPKVEMPNRHGFVPSPWRKWTPGEKRPFGVYPE